jgi:hypothetical protein
VAWFRKDDSASKLPEIKLYEIIVENTIAKAEIDLLSNRANLSGLVDEYLKNIS